MFLASFIERPKKAQGFNVRLTLLLVFNSVYTFIRLVGRMVFYVLNSNVLGLMRNELRKALRERRIP
jgi:hypothetical protein